MQLQRYHKTFRPITKSVLREANQLKNSDELCGVASIVMLLRWCRNPSQSFEDVYNRMIELNAYVEGVGTYLERAVGLDRRNLYYFWYMPSVLIRLLLGRRYAMAVSVKKSNEGSHIVFVCGATPNGVRYYDPNKDAKMHTIAYEKWRTISNKRAIVMRVRR